MEQYTPASSLPTSLMLVAEPMTLEQLQASLALLPIPAWLFDARGKLRFVNAATLRLFTVADQAAFVALVGGTVAEQMARLRPRLASASTIARATEESIYTFTPERMVTERNRPAWGSERRREQAEPLRQDELPISRALKKRAINEQLLSMLHPTHDAEIIVRAVASPVVDANDRVLGGILLTLDITDQMLEDGRRDAILSLAGHDIRNPLTPARGYLQQLRIMLKHEEARFTREIDFIDRVLAQLDRIAQIANDLDAIAVNDHGEATASMASCDLVALCRQVQQKQLGRHPETPVELRANAEEMWGVWSQLHLERALVMLVDSAARRSPPGRPVVIRLKQLRREFKVEIADQGAAMSAERLELLRGVLSRGGAALALTHGWDLDLSTVQTVLGLNRSRLHVASHPRTGTTFWFSLLAPLPDPLLGE